MLKSQAVPRKDDNFDTLCVLGTLLTPELTGLNIVN